MIVLPPPVINYSEDRFYNIRVLLVQLRYKRSYKKQSEMKQSAGITWQQSNMGRDPCFQTAFVSIVDEDLN